MGVCKWRSIPALGALQTLTKSGRILLAHERLQMGQKMDVYEFTGCNGGTLQTLLL